ncbi:MAG TPA: long-chain fatty acid--CoA ligase [Blastocatellia bacterium]|nr:long-chain fatty acid--CoA ligase [Blastocatellia bacterium]
MKHANIYSLFREKAEQYRGRDVFYVRVNGQWAGVSWDRFRMEAHEFGYALIASGLEPQTPLCILMGTVPQWPVADVGTIIAGGVSVGLYPTSSAEQCKYIINHSDAEFVLVDNQHQLDKILGIRKGLPKVRKIIALDCRGEEESEGVLSYEAFLRLGREHSASADPVVKQRGQSARPDDTAIMVYTSGTTALPKGACLSHRYIINSVESLRGTIPLYDSDRSFSYLPYCHVAERISGFYNRLYAGAPAYFADDLTKLWDFMHEVKPTVFGSLPRFFEKAHSRIMTDVEKSSPEEQARFYEALDIGRGVSRLGQAGRPVPEDLRAEYEQKTLPFVSKIKSYFGGDLRVATSGGASLPVEIQEFFDAFGLPILQAYGLTENLCVAFNRPDNYRFQTVGPPMPGCEVKIADDGEILVRSEMMFSGYYKEPEKTASTFRDGWLLTGDLGEIDEQGFLKITGRKKELIITSTGKNIAPALIENLIKEHPVISQAMAYGEGKSHLVALITLNPVEGQQYALARGIEFDDFSDLTRKPQIRSLVESIVERANSRVSSTEAIRKFVILDRDLSIERDEITPTMKIKRNVVTGRYAELLERLYE